MDYIISTTLYLLKGTYTTLSLYFVTAIFSLPLGIIFAALQFSTPKFVRYIFDIYAWIFRGTPLVLQLIFIYYGLPLMTNNMIAFPAFASAAITFILNYAAYLMEIFRSGIESIEKGQYEAGQVLGLTDNQIFFRIVLIQVLKRILAPLSNEVITLVKDTSLARVIAVGELIRAAQDIVAQQALIWPLFYTGIFYLVFNGLLTLAFGALEKKLDYFKG